MPTILSPYLPTIQTKESVRKALGLDERRIKEAVNGIRKWLESQPHLPKEEDDERLERWLLRCENNMEKTKQTLDMYYTLKGTVPELMSGWNVKEPWFETIKKYWYTVCLLELTPDLDRVIYMGLKSEELGEDFVLEDCFKVIFLGNEIRLFEDYYDKDIIIYDLKNISFKYVIKFTPPFIKKLETCSQRAYNAQLRAIHLINTPAFAEAFIKRAKSLLKNTLADKVQVHSSDLTELYKQVPKRILPNDIGGEAGSLDDLNDQTFLRLQDHSDLLAGRGKLKSDESKRPIGMKTASDLFGFEGSFRTLSLD